MSDLFGAAASDLAGLAARALGWRPSEFWQATPADLMLAIKDPDQNSASLSRDDLNTMLEREGDG